MPCDIRNDAIVCSRQGLKPCHYCGQVAPILCDWPLGDGKTCDRAVCTRHRVAVKPGIDYCTEHAGEVSSGVNASGEV